MKLVHLMKLIARVDAPIPIGKVLTGVRMIYTVTGGEFEGSRLRGKVLPGGKTNLSFRYHIIIFKEVCKSTVNNIGK